MKLLVHVLSASVLASTVLASPTSEVTRNFVLAGEILVYSPRLSGLPAATVVAPRGARGDGDVLLRIESISAASPDLSRLESGPLVHGSNPLVIGEHGATPLTLGDLSLQLRAGQWTFFGQDGELEGRPIFSIMQQAATLKRSSDHEFTLTGELVLDDSMAAELGLEPSTAHPLIVGSVVIRGSSYPGADYTTNGVHVKTQPTVASSALAVAGPDVIVSTIGNSSASTDFAEYGVVGTIGAHAVATVSCNIGTQDAIWIDCSSGPQCNQHPVIGTQLYRLKTVAGSTRFEQIGMSWLKHGFCAADASNCGQTPTPNSSCDWLGLWSTDTYGSGLNASHSGCGPRSEINPWTGYFPYPYVLNWGVPGNSIYKRLQIEQADLDPAQNTGASYLCDVVYICTDEPDANRYNNYSNRAATVGALVGGQYNMTFSGTTNREQSALERWPILDAGVTLVAVDVPGDGRFWVGAKVTDLGGGTWHYEYAVLNMNCHDAAQRLSVPADFTVSVTPATIGFHDVPYHSGEPYSGADWNAVRSTSNVEWTTQTFAANANANALRWSTTYNFRFDANIAPVSGNIEIGLFRSGGTALAVGVPVPGSLGVPTPVCFGDGSGTACPCANFGAAGNGCAHSGNAAGANLSTAGLPRISADDFVLTTTGMPEGPGRYLQATTAAGGGFTFGDGLICASGPTLLMNVKFANGGVLSYPEVGDPALSVAGFATAGDSRFYQLWFRDSETFCTASTFNLTNAIQMIWVP